MARSWSVLSAAALITVVASCGDSTSPGTKAQGTARFLNGATPRAAGTRAAFAIAAAPPGNGEWLLSPDKVTLTLKRLFFSGGTNGSQSTATVNCTITYDKSKAGLTQLADCPFTLDTGTYTQVTPFFAGTYDLFVNDAANGFYTTATGIVTTAPAGGAQTFSFAVPNATNGEFAPSPIRLPAPLVVTDSSAITLSVVVNGLQFFHATVASGAVSTTSTSPQTPSLVATVGAIAGVELYSHSAIATADTRCAFQCGTTSPNGVTSVGIYYTSATTPVVAAAALNGPPACMSAGAISIVQGDKSYIGLDGSGNLGWALPTDQTYTAYSAEMRMARATTIGSTTTLYCKARSTDPAPAGGSYASGAPAINVAANALATYVLVAK